MPSFIYHALVWAEELRRPLWRVPKWHCFLYRNEGLIISRNTVCEFEFFRAPQILGRCIRCQRTTERGHCYGWSPCWIHGPVGTLDVLSLLTLVFAYSLTANDIQKSGIDRSSRDQHHYLYGYRNSPWQKPSVRKVQ
jgi:hypothetical protein